ncbi:MAG: RT0821/Lpp0805 family surface protein [Xanthobacteraceae bacterium]
MSMQLDSLFSGKDDEPKTADKDDPRDVTGSLPLQSARSASPNEGMTKADWTFATAALREALTRNEEGASIPWQNPTTGARGSVTPVAAAYVRDGFACRNFLASHIGKANEGWFEGTACRVHRGEWDVHSTRPLRKS